MNISSLAHNPILSWNRVSGKPGAVHFGALIFILGTLLAVNWVGFGEPKTAEKESIDRISDPVKSSNAEAQALFHQALTVLMLPEDEARLNSSLSLFQRVIEIDPDFPGGFAGKSIALSFKVLFIKANDPSRDLEEVTDLAERAVESSSDFSLGYAALSLANSLSSEPGPALSNTRRVLAIRPHLAHANAISALALIISGEPAKTINILIEAVSLEPDDPRTPYLNLLGAAHYVVGDYVKSAEYFERNIDRGGPSGPHIDIFLAASYVQMGKEFEAQAIVDKLRETNSGFPFERWLKNYLSEDQLRLIMDRLGALGLPR